MPIRRRRNSLENTIPRRCHRCHGLGRADCSICGGSGKVRKGTDKLGAASFQSCTGCFGNRVTRCSLCNGTGFLPA